MIIYISLILLFISCSAKWIMDTLKFHYDKSFWKNLKYQDYFNPILSWDNKYLRYIKRSKIIKWLMENPLVFLTDFYHLMQFIHLNGYMLVIALNIGSDWLSRLIIFVIIRLIYSITGLIFYKNK